jgi:hypothetical protein
MGRLAGWLACILLLGPAAFPQSKPAQYSDLTFTVIKAENGKPVRNAAVVLHQITKDGRQESGGIQLKTGPEGQAKYGGVPYGKLRVQVIARGLQTFGRDFDISQPAQEIVIKLKPPQEQYSIYK